jgi:hypothetical protein
MAGQRPSGADRFAAALAVLWTAVDFLLEREAARAQDDAAHDADLARAQRLRDELRRLVVPILSP